MGYLANKIESPWVWLSAILTGIYVVAAIRNYLKLRQFSGPLLAGWSNWPHSAAYLRRDCEGWYAEVCEKYGPLARIAPNILVTSSPEIYQHVNKNTNYQRSDWFYKAMRFEHRRDHIFSQTDTVKHERRRKQMAQGYSGKENLDLGLSIDQHVRELVNLLRTKHISSDANNVPVDMAKKIHYLTLDVISSVGFGKSFGMLRSDSDVDGYLQSCEDGLDIMNNSLGLGIIWIAQMPVLGKLISPSPTSNNGFGRMLATCFRCVDERAANPTDKRSDMLASFMRHGIADDDLRSEALAQILGGSGSTSSAMCAVLLYILATPPVYTKLRRELDDAERDGRAPPRGSADGNTTISAVQARKLPYLQAVIREATRLRPPVALLQPRDVPPGGDTVFFNGQHIFLPGGTCVGASICAMQRSVATFGADAEAFRPERWLNTDAERLAAMTRTNDLLFNYGRTQCLGKPVAQTELGKAIFELMRNFDMALINPARPWRTKSCIGQTEIYDMWVRVTERDA